LDQGGNVWEWTDTIFGQINRGLRGGSYIGSLFDLSTSARFEEHPEEEISDIGFRVASVPEPSTLALASLGLLVGVAAALQKRRSAR
jgi:hypothetical protein